ncbi:MAG: HlyC/CorC family transporter [Deltaproteobacteria bacterium]|nr:HlyC/CorC family transporter [Deltaproteobacteria bacterium]
MPSDGLIFEAIAIIVLILLNGFFASAEIAIITAKRSVLEKLAKEGSQAAVIVARLKEDPDRLLATVQVGVTVVGTLASALGGIAAAQSLKPVLSAIPVAFIRDGAEILSVGAVVIVISYVSLVVGELVPKSLALRHAERAACIAARPVDLLSRLTSFFVRILTASTRTVLKALGVKGEEKRVFISEEEVKFFIREGRATGVFEETEAALLHGIFEFADATVKEIMVPKHKFSAIEVDTPPEAALRFISETGFSRYPVYQDSLDKVVGVLYNKDVFICIERSKPVVIKDLLRPPYFVPNSVMISRLLREMQRRKVHIAIVVDEHGDVDGLVTIEDILEEIVGEIEDEYDVGKGGLVEKLRDGSLLIDASASLGDLEDAGVVIEEEDEEFHTLAGFMLAKLQRIPRGGEFVVYKGRRFTVVDVELNRIVKVKVEPIDRARINGAVKTAKETGK